MRCSILFFFLLYIGANAAAQVLIDSIVAVVNTEAITRSELENEFRIAAIVGKPAVEPLTFTEKRAVLETVINRKFVLQEAERIGVVIAERDDRITEKITEISQTIRFQHGFPKRFTTASVRKRNLEGVGL